MERERPDLVVADVTDAGSERRGPVSTMKAAVDRRSIPVILMSSVGRRSADGTGADAFIAKPFDLDQRRRLYRASWHRGRLARSATQIAKQTPPGGPATTADC
jgi:CheY-like chemotaxis protein